MGLGDKAAAFKLVERNMATSPIEKDAFLGPCAIEILARVAAGTGESDRAIAALEKLLSVPYGGAMGMSAPLTPALLRLDPMFDPLRNVPLDEVKSGGFVTKAHVGQREKSHQLIVSGCSLRKDSSSLRACRQLSWAATWSPAASWA
jgi:hypothetical protein